MRALAYVVTLGTAAMISGCGVGGTDSLFVSGGVGGGTQNNTGGQGGVSNPTGGGQGGTPTSSTSQSSTNVSSSQSSSAQSSSAMSSSSTGNPGKTVDCGNGMTCPINGKNACCWNQFADNPTGSCVDGDPNSDGCDTQPMGRPHVQIGCQLPSDCPNGQVCCGHRAMVGGNQYYDVVSCQPSCDGMNITLCDPNDNTNSCGQGDCVDSGTLPPGYSICNN